MRHCTSLFARWCVAALVGSTLVACQPVKPTQHPAAAPPSSSPLGTEPLTIESLPVGSGMCHVVVCPGTDPAGAKDALIVDCGSSKRGPADWDFDKVYAHVAPLISGRRVTVVLSHGHVDHTSYISQLFPNGKGVAALYYGGKATDYGTTRGWIDQVKKLGKPVYGEGGIYEGTGLVCGAAEGEVLAVNAVSGIPNASSLVLGLEFAGKSAILPGDATGATEKEAIIFARGRLRAALVDASHHGAKTQDSNSAQWVDETQPDYLFVSAGPVGHHGHPDCAVVDRYEPFLDFAPTHNETCGMGRSSNKTVARDKAIFNTEDDGLLTFTITPAGAASVMATPTH